MFQTQMCFHIAVKDSLQPVFLNSRLVRKLRCLDRDREMLEVPQLDGAQQEGPSTSVLTTTHTSLLE